MECGMCIWYYHSKTKDWVHSIVRDKKDSQLEIEYQVQGQELELEWINFDNLQKELPRYLRRTEQPSLSRENDYKNVQDLTRLTYLNEAEILYTLETRYMADIIYSRAGNILLAVNPLRDVNEFYGGSMKHKYVRHGYVMDDEVVEPHVYDTANRAYHAMLKAVKERKYHPKKFHKREMSQTILVAGESGAGKTHTTKLMMNYLAELAEYQEMSSIQSLYSDKMSVPREKNSLITQRVLQSNPILESFGNARTVRNDNSSRFGKFMKIYFASDTGKLEGATITTYLLERTRIITQSNDERNYHVFYELLAGMTSEEKRVEYHLQDVGMEDFYYLSQSQCYHRHDGVADEKLFQALCTSMTTIGIESKEQDDIFKLLSAILHLGNITYTHEVKNSEDSTAMFSMDNKTAGIVAEILGISMDQLEALNCKRLIQAGRSETIQVGLTPPQAIHTRDSLGKILYSTLFSWLVCRINQSMNPDAVHAKSDKLHPFIAILDIFGFEVLQNNGLEQLCINYANEKLQALFNEYIFEMEQIEYRKEGIEWNPIEYPNNLHVVQMLESKASSTGCIGLFTLLDEQSILPNGSDASFVQALYDQGDKMDAKTSTFLQGSPLDKSNGVFTIEHYASAVVYDADGFCEKNKDHLNLDIVTGLRDITASPFLQQLLNSVPAPEQKVSAIKKQRSSSLVSSTVAGNFKRQLNTLLKVINTTEPHFIRCIKPNDEMNSQYFHSSRVMEQLRYSGIVQVVKISRSGYSIRFSFGTFLARYGFLKKSYFDKISKSFSDSKRVDYILNDFVTADLPNMSNEDVPPYQLGTSLVFLMHGVYHSLEHHRLSFEISAITKIQSMVRGCSYRKRMWRQALEATKLQAWFKMLYHRKQYCTAIRGIALTQALVRRYLAIISPLKQEAAARIIQTKVQNYLGKASVEKENYNLVWNNGVLGLFFEMDTTRYLPVVRRIHRSLSSCNEIADVRVGDLMTQIGTVALTKSSNSIKEILDMLQTVEKPVTLQFRKMHSMTEKCSTSSSKCTEVLDEMQDIADDEYEVLWEENVPLGLGLRPHPTMGLPFVSRHTGTPCLPGMDNVRQNHLLVYINEMSTKDISFDEVIHVLENEVRPLVLRFQQCSTSDADDALNENENDDVHEEHYRMSNMDHKRLMSELLYHVTWHEEDGPLGIVVKQSETSYYPVVNRIKSDCKLQSEGNQHIGVGDLLLCINNNNISKLGFKGAMHTLRYGPKPILLTFQRKRI